MQFQPHGELQVRIEYPLLISVAHGPWNRELVSIWRQQALPYALQLQQQGPWIGVGVMRDSMTCTADALPLHRETAQFMIEHLGAIASAHVAAPTVDGYGLMRGVFDRLFEGLCPHAHFDRLEDVHGWADEQLRLHAQSSLGR